MGFVFIICVILGLWCIAAMIIYRNSISYRKADQIIFAKTQDHVDIALHRYLPRGQTKKNCPVILCPGLGANRYNMDMDDQYSIAIHLANQGYDCFILELRGVGLSEMPEKYYLGRWKITFEDFVRKDIPAAIQKVLSITFADRVHWVGHSMGGMVLYAYAIEQKNQFIQSGTIIASPANFNYMAKMSKLAQFGKFILHFFPVLHLRLFTFLALPGIGWLDRHLGKWLYEPKHCETSMIQYAAVNLVIDLPATLMQRFERWVNKKDFCSEDGIHWQDRLSEITIPLYLLAGTSDRLAIVEGIQAVYQQLGTQDKTFRVFGKDHGEPSEYAHGDFVIGRSAPERVFPSISEWVNQHD
ncbi:MAG: alpha/beta fold hydrolase [Desulfobacterales bacterium]|nr:alpha/beta fold hydrolase [Desulfobacterales bacterium]